MRWSVLRSAAPTLAVVAAVLVPFAREAFTIDDTVFLLQAQHALSDPLHPTAFVTVWSDPPLPVRLSAILPTGPVTAWLLMPSVLAGGSEVLAHLTQLAAFALAILATAALALRMGLSSRWAAAAGLLLGATPTALAMACTAMPDVPAMALGAAGLERLVAWRDERRLHQAIVAALALGLAPMARTHACVLLGVGALLLAGDYLTTRERLRQAWTTWVPLAAAAALTLAILVVTRDPEGSAADLAGAARSFSGTLNVPRNAVSFAVHWVLAIPLAVPWLLLRPGHVSRRWGVFLLATGAAGVQIWSEGRGWSLAIAPVAGLGAAVLADVLLDAWRRRDSTQLTLGVWLLAAVPVTLYVHMPAKYLLVSAPAAALLVARTASTRAAAFVRPAIALTAAAGLALGVSILRANTAFAGLGRRAAAELIAPNVSAGHRVWFAGNWGFQWYATRAGGTIVTLVSPQPQAGDLLVTSEKTEAAPAVRAMLASRYGPRTRHLARLEDRSAGGRTMDSRSGAGFFSNEWGHLPWSWSDAPLDQFDLWRIE